MTLPRRHFLHLAAAAAVLPGASQIVNAQGYPTRPVRIIVGYAPGIAPDVVTRLLAPFLSERLGQQIIVDNRPGAANNIATEAVVRAPADGYTLLLVPSTSTYNATLYDNLNFDLIRDIAPVASIAGAPFVMVVTPLSPGGIGGSHKGSDGRFATSLQTSGATLVNDRQEILREF